MPIWKKTKEKIEQINEFVANTYILEYEPSLVTKENHLSDKENLVKKENHYFEALHLGVHTSDLITRNGLLPNKNLEIPNMLLCFYKELQRSLCYLEVSVNRIHRSPVNSDHCP